MSFILIRMLSTKTNDKLKRGKKHLANILNQMAFAILGNSKHLHCLIHGLVVSKKESEKYFVKNVVSFIKMIEKPNRTLVFILYLLYLHHFR